MEVVVDQDIQWHQAPEKESLAELVVGAICQALQAATQKQGRASLLLSGGSTPQLAYQLLSNATLPWDKLQISLTDERQVDDGHEASNAVMVWQRLLAKRPQVQWFPLWQTGWTCQDIAEIKARTAEMQTPFDVVLLGMGDDGHFASLFPNCSASAQALHGDSDRLLCTTAPNAPTARISWSLKALLDSKELMLYITGDRKKAIVQAAYQADSAESKLPIGYLVRALQAAGRPLKVYWS